MATFYMSFSFHDEDYDMVTTSTWILVSHIDDPEFDTGDILRIFARYVPGHLEGKIGPQIFSNGIWQIYHFFGDSVYLPDYIVIPCSLLAYIVFTNNPQLISFRFHGMD